MVTVFIKNSSTAYRFPTLKLAETWADEQGYDKSLLEMFSDTVPEDALEIDSTLYIRQCKGCQRYIKFEKLPEEEIVDVICPNCGTHLGRP